MSESFAASDLPAPYVCSVFTCPCGRRSVRHGHQAGSLPPGWVEVATEEGEVGHLCDVCCKMRDRPGALDRS